MSHITRDSIKDSVHKLHEEAKVQSEEKAAPSTENEYYTFFGNHQFLDEAGFPRLIDEEYSDLIHAKKILANDRFKYYVKQENGMPYNPNPSIPARKSDKMHHAANASSFMLVSPETFKHYVKFLKTKNIAHLVNANRSV
jgi:hypothetical protein